ncbi:MAG TPA: PAS domain S-box protein [Burkholderiales bacterium]|jgi:PAS domain S-box-containing protein
MAGTESLVDPLIFHLVVQQVKDYALFVLDPAGRIMTWNLGAQRIKGYAPEEIVGRHFSTFYTPDAVARGWPAEELRLATREGRFEDEGWRVRKDGSRFWANVVITALRDDDGKLLGFSKITRDLTERKLHEEALRQAEERFRLLVDGVLDYAIFMLDPDGVVTSWNAGAQRIKGYAPEEVIGKHLSCFYPDEDVEAGKPWEALATARREGRAEAEGWRLKKGGERFWARVVVTPLHDASGHLRGFAKVTQDLSDRRHLQSLQDAAREVNEFIATLAHELRNPLAPIRTAVEVMAKVPGSDPAQQAMRETIDRQSAQLARIVDDMLDIARVTRGVLSLEQAPADLAVAVRHAVETSAPAIESGRHRLDVELSPGPLVVHGDMHRLTQILVNLLNNAARYTPQAGRIAVRARREDGWAAIEVSDNGRGIEPLMLERIFHMFVQGRAALDKIGAGLGVGLALARRIAEAHGGTLQAQSEGENKGARFTLRLPLLKAAAQPEDAAVQVADGAVVAKRILVVDDNIDAAVTLALLLKSLGHETCVVHDGLQALRMAAQFRPDVVLLDIGMPGLDGYEVARRLRALKRERPLRIVAVTGWGQEADRARSREAGFDVHLVKPVDPTVLTSAIANNNGATLH